MSLEYTIEVEVSIWDLAKALTFYEEHREVCEWLSKTHYCNVEDSTTQVELRLNVFMPAFKERCHNLAREQHESEEAHQKRLAEQRKIHVNNIKSFQEFRKILGIQ
ncbi:hypothetical protein ACFLZ4_01625 [Patescibacteria group bacterium]